MLKSTNPKPLVDHRLELERWTSLRRQHRGLPLEYGNFMSTLAAWDWFVTLTMRSAPVSPNQGPRDADVALTGVESWLSDLALAAGTPVGWVIAEEFGRTGGRWHCHLLVTGVGKLCIEEHVWRVRQRFGRPSRIQRFDPARGAAFYLAKCAGRLPGKITLGGTLRGVDLSKCYHSHPESGGQDIAVSAAMTRRSYYQRRPRGRL